MRPASRPLAAASGTEGWCPTAGRDTIAAVVPEEIGARLAAMEIDVARAHRLDLSSTSATRALREHFVRLATSEPTIEARVSVHGPALQALLVTLGERYGALVYRRPRQRDTTLMLSGPRTFVHEVIGPMLQQMSDVLDAWFLDRTQAALRSFDESVER